MPCNVWQSVDHCGLAVDCTIHTCGRTETSKMSRRNRSVEKTCCSPHRRALRGCSQASCKMPTTNLRLRQRKSQARTTHIAAHGSEGGLGTGGSATQQRCSVGGTTTPVKDTCGNCSQPRRQVEVPYSRSRRTCGDKACSDDTCPNRVVPSVTGNKCRCHQWHANKLCNVDRVSWKTQLCM